MDNIVKFLLISVVLLIQSSEEANILGIVPLPSKSHTILFQDFMVTLAEKGHNVTFINCLSLGKSVPNLTEITLPFDFESFSKHVTLDLFSMRHQAFWHYMINMPLLGLTIADLLLKNSELQKVLNSGDQYDLIIGELFLTESVMAGVAEKIKAPFIGFFTMPPNTWINYASGNMAPTSFTPDLYLGFPTKMSFFQRFGSLLHSLVGNAFYHYYYLPRQEKLYREYFGNNAAPMMDHIYNSSLIFVNDHCSLSYARPLVPNVIPIGGIHVGQPKKLPENIQTLLDSSTEGAILFSMGANMRSSQMPKETLQVFLNVFSKIKPNVIWKFEENLNDLPQNVHIFKWLPQSDILAHPNMKIFITHAGMMSTTEAVVRGVPVIGIPIFGDQPINMVQAVNAGSAISLDYDNINEDNLLAAINEMLENPKYAIAAKHRSSLLADQPLSPMETAIFWVEYVIRRKDTSHLKTELLRMPWYKANQADVIILMIVISIVIIKLMFVIVRAIASKLISFAFSSNIDSKKLR